MSRTPEFSICGNLNSVLHTLLDQDLSSTAMGTRQRSHSYYNKEDVKNYGLQTQTEQPLVRPRSRYVCLFHFSSLVLLYYPLEITNQMEACVFTHDHPHEHSQHDQYHCFLFRSFYSYETSEMYADFNLGNFSRSSPLRQSSNSMKSKNGDEDSKGTGVPVSSKFKSKLNRHSRSRERNGMQI